MGRCELSPRSSNYYFSVLAAAKNGQNINTPPVRRSLHAHTKRDEPPSCRLSQHHRRENRTTHARLVSTD